MWGAEAQSAIWQSPSLTPGSCTLNVLQTRIVCLPETVLWLAGNSAKAMTANSKKRQSSSCSFGVLCTLCPQNSLPLVTELGSPRSTPCKKRKSNMQQVNMQRQPWVEEALHPVACIARPRQLPLFVSAANRWTISVKIIITYLHELHCNSDHANNVASGYFSTA